MKYSGYSAREVELLDLLERKGLVVLTTTDARRLLGVGANDAHRILSRMVAKGHLVRLERGKYLDARRTPEMDVYEVAPRVVEPSYLSLWSGLHVHGLTTQVPRTVFVVLTSSRTGLEVLGSPVRFVCVRPRLFFGYRAYGRTVAAEPEKLLLDCLLFPQHCGGWEEVLTSFGNARLDTERVVEYALVTGSPTLCSRLGYTLERLGLDFDGEAVRRASYRGRVPLDPSRPVRSRRSSSRWNLLLNVEGDPC